ncbi:MAG: hypothetical protein U0804_03840 [Gemmataceae bacterium]
MTSRAVCVALLLSALSATGCGTVANLAGAGPGAKAPFGGVAHDVRCLNGASAGHSGVGPLEADGMTGPRVGSMILCAADLPLSLVGDALTWPYTRAYTCVNEPTDLPPILVAPPPAEVQPRPTP